MIFLSSFNNILLFLNYNILNYTKFLLLNSFNILFILSLILQSYPSGSADVPEHLLPHLIPLKKIDLYDEIGKGEFGVVYRGVYCHNKCKEIVAVKVFPCKLQNL